eukprot:GHVP01009804.1.p2 GENE.GHVP01009804.1~~GHVP01009804.1.p2  ORF type:complete len:342 (-),score=69.32 GHVP01009804.1:1368-2393(-)
MVNNFAEDFMRPKFWLQKTFDFEVALNFIRCSTTEEDGESPSWFKTFLKTGDLVTSRRSRDLHLNGREFRRKKSIKPILWSTATGSSKGAVHLFEAPDSDLGSVVNEGLFDDLERQICLATGRTRMAFNKFHWQSGGEWMDRDSLASTFNRFLKSVSHLYDDLTMRSVAKIIDLPSTEPPLETFKRIYEAAVVAKIAAEEATEAEDLLFARRDLHPQAEVAPAVSAVVTHLSEKGLAAVWKSNEEQRLWGELEAELAGWSFLCHMREKRSKSGKEEIDVYKFKFRCKTKTIHSCGRSNCTECKGSKKLERLSSYTICLWDNKALLSELHTCDWNLNNSLEL